ncbi:hypothetical protein D3C85_1476870 [compost metagenome]
MGQPAQLGDSPLGEPEAAAGGGEPLSHAFIHAFVSQGVIRHGLPPGLSLWLLHARLLLCLFEYPVASG